jgi:hypothetical protein
MSEWSNMSTCRLLSWNQNNMSEWSNMSTCRLLSWNQNNMSEWSNMSTCRLLSWNQNKDMLLHSDILFWFQDNESAGRHIAPLRHIILIPRQQSAGRHVAPLRHIILIPRQQSAGRQVEQYVYLQTCCLGIRIICLSGAICLPADLFQWDSTIKINFSMLV